MSLNVFISHSSQNAWIMPDLMKLIEAVNNQSVIFCSADSNSIELASDFKETIYNSLQNADVFVAVISKEYWASKYCIFELGAAYERYCDDSVKSIQILPLLLPPLSRAQALANTPMVQMQIEEITSPESVAKFLSMFTEDRDIRAMRKYNVEIAEFCTKIQESILKKTSLYDDLEAGAYFDERGKLPIPRDRIAKCRRTENAFEFTFNLSKLEYEDDPSFASVALMYWNNVNLRDYLSFDSDACFCFTVDNRDGILKALTVEFKSSLNNKQFTHTTMLEAGCNEVSIPLKKMDYDPLESIREICFVIHPENMNGLDGEIVISNIHVDFHAKNIFVE